MFKELFQEVKNDVKALANGVKALAKSSYTKTAAVLGAAGAMIAEAHAEVTLPTTGVNVGDYITAGITSVAAVVGVALGGYVAFKVVHKGCKWLGKALG